MRSNSEGTLYVFLRQRALSVFFLRQRAQCVFVR